jgi:sulfate permease, SulP family
MELNIKVATMFCFLVGGILVIVGLCKLTFLVRFLSRPTLSGFVSAAALIIAATQSKNLFGLAEHLSDVKGFFPIVFGIIRHTKHINFIAVGMGKGEWRLEGRLILINNYFEIGKLLENYWISVKWKV